MKLIFYFMLIVNLAMAAWLLNSLQVHQPNVKLSFKDVGDLKIVSDIELQVRSDFQTDIEKKLKYKQKEIEPKVSEIDDELPRLEYDDFIFDEDDGSKTVCRRLGPFKEKSEAVNIAGGLATYRLVAKVIRDTDIVTVGYWAVLPSPPTRKEANQILKKLKSKGLVDVRRFVTGNMLNAISLGLFSSEINAKKRVRSVEKLGFLAIVKPKQEEVDSYWLEFSQPSGFQLPMHGVNTNYPDVKIKTCSGIASGGSIP